MMGFHVFLSIRDSFLVEFVVVYMGFIGVNNDVFMLVFTAWECEYE